MKYVVISKLSPGIDNAKKALEVFGKVGSGADTEMLLAGTDGKTFVVFIDSDTPDMTVSLTYAPLFESVEVIPVVPMDDAWMTAIQSAVSNWG
jgi:hypothetical protein